MNISPKKYIHENMIKKHTKILSVLFVIKQIKTKHCISI